MCPNSTDHLKFPRQLLDKLLIKKFVSLCMANLKFESNQSSESLLQCIDVHVSNWTGMSERQEESYAIACENFFFP